MAAFDLCMAVSFFSLVLHLMRNQQQKPLRREVLRTHAPQFAFVNYDTGDFLAGRNHSLFIATLRVVTRTWGLPPRYYVEDFIGINEFPERYAGY